MRRKQTVGASWIVIRGLAGCGGECDQRTLTSAHSSEPSCTTPAAAEGIIAAGIQNQDREACARQFHALLKARGGIRHVLRIGFVFGIEIHGD